MKFYLVELVYWNLHSEANNSIHLRIRLIFDIKVKCRDQLLLKKGTVVTVIIKQYRHTVDFSTRKVNRNKSRHTGENKTLSVTHYRYQYLPWEAMLGPWRLHSSPVLVQAPTKTQKRRPFLLIVELRKQKIKLNIHYMLIMMNCLFICERKNLPMNYIQRKRNWEGWHVAVFWHDPTPAIPKNNFCQKRRKLESAIVTTIITKRRRRRSIK